MNYERTDGRAVNELRPLKITPHYYSHAEGSALIEMGNTRIICAASVDERVPFFLKGKGSGWVTAEYAMLPRATAQRTQRESGRNGVSGRTQEIQRLIGRSLRAVMDMKVLGERQILLDCDVIQADGGTRTASITGAYIALALACRKLLETKKVARNPLKSEVAAVSVGIHRGVPLLDLKYDEDSVAETDMNVVCTGDGRFIEVQGTAEGAPFSQAEMDALLSLANEGIVHLIAAQRQALI